MKVIVLSSVHDAFDVRIFHKECKSLARAGYGVTLIVPHGRDEVVDGVQIKAVPKTGGRISRMAKTVWQVYREAARLNARLYHFHDPELIPVGLLLRARGKKVIYDIHEDYPQAILSKYYLRHWIRRPGSWVMERFENFASRRLSALVAATPAIAERFRGMNGRTVAIQNFPLKDEMITGWDIRWRDRPLDIVYAGGITAIRGIRQMVEAMGLLPEGLATKLILAGELSPPSFRHELAGLPGWGRVEMLGLISRRAVAQLFGNVRAGLVLFLPEPNHVRSQPNKLFEYMSAGIPVIASDFPLWREIVEEAGCGLVVNPLDPQAIAGAIEHLLTHPEEAEAMGRRGREAVEKKYNWASEEKKLLALYEEVLANA
jgi:hypothetical protein